MTTTTTPPEPSADASAATSASTSTQPKRRVIRRRRRATNSTTPAAIDPTLLQTVIRDSGLPAAYSFELEKTVQRILQVSATHVALQMPEGLLLYATVLSDVLQRLVAACRKTSTALQVSILGDVTYGACCIDDLGAQALGADLLVHYGHSCLVPLQHTVVPCLYIFCEIQIDTEHLVACLVATLSSSPRDTPIYLLGTVQFRHALATLQDSLRTQHHYTQVHIPQAKPLSPGEVLGCTSPTLPDQGQDCVVVFVADGRFHLEATLIAHPRLAAAYRYDPYGKTLTHESYRHDEMHALRQSAIAAATGRTFGILLGTLGRQGNPAIVQKVRQLLQQHGKRSFVLLVSEVTPAKLALLAHRVDAWVQVACPRLSVDWGHLLTTDNAKPVLNPYELHVCLGATPWQDVYPMDYYRRDGGVWTNYHAETADRRYDAVCGNEPCCGKESCCEQEQ